MLTSGDASVSLHFEIISRRVIFTRAEKRVPNTERLYLLHGRPNSRTAATFNRPTLRTSTKPFLRSRAAIRGNRAVSVSRDVAGL